MLAGRCKHGLAELAAIAGMLDVALLVQFRPIKVINLLVILQLKPYYLHHCDLAEGISHFRTNFEQGQELMRAIRGHVSGLAQPEYVLHIPDGSGKVPIVPTYLERHGTGWIVTDYLGRRRVYPGAYSSAPLAQTGAAL